MKILLISLLILSFLGISILSFVAMYHGSSHENGLCITETATGFDCPANPFAFADFHLSLFRGFSSAYLGNFFNTYLALLAFLLFGLFFEFFERYSLTGKSKHYQFKGFFKSFTPLVQSKNYYWISLHENSPAVQ